VGYITDQLVSLVIFHAAILRFCEYFREAIRAVSSEELSGKRIYRPFGRFGKSVSGLVIPYHDMN
jgi:hypothetical protein